MLCDNLEGWDGVGDRRKDQEGGAYIYPWLSHVDVWQKPRRYCKAIILQNVCVCVCVCGVCIQYTQMPTHIPWRREKLPTPGFRPGEFQGLCGAWDHKESDTTERLWLTHSHTTHILHWYNKPHSSVIQIHVFSWFQLSQLCHQALTNSNKHGYFFFNWS